MFKQRLLAMSMVGALALTMSSSAFAHEKESAEPSHSAAPAPRQEQPRAVERPRPQTPPQTPPPVASRPAPPVQRQEPVHQEPARRESRQPAQVTTQPDYGHKTIEPVPRGNNGNSQAQVQPQVQQPRPQPYVHIEQPKIQPAQTREVDVKHSPLVNNEHAGKFIDTSKTATARNTKDGGQVIQQGDNRVKLDAGGNIVGGSRQIRNSSGQFVGSEKLNASGRVVEKSETVHQSNGEIEKTSTHFNSQGNPVAVNKVTSTNNGIQLRSSQDSRRGVNYSETYNAHNNTVVRVVQRNNITIINNYNINNYHDRPYYSYRSSSFERGFLTGVVVGAIAASLYVNTWQPYDSDWRARGYYYTPIPIVSACLGMCWFVPRVNYVNYWEYSSDAIAESYYLEQQQEVARAQADAANAEASAQQAQYNAAQAQADAAAARADAAAMSKQLADQARQQALAINSTGQSVPLVTDNGGILNDMKYVFFVDEDKTATDQATQDGCDLSHGATLKLAQRVMDNSSDDQQLVYFKVNSSKPGDCRAGVTVSLPLEDAQDFVNEFNARVDQQMKNPPKGVQVK